MEQETLHILSMSQEELHEFLQTEEIENPLLNYSLSEVSYPERMRQTRAVAGAGFDKQALNKLANREFSVAGFVMNQIPAGRLTSQEQRIARYAVDLLDKNGFLSTDARDIAADLSLPLPVTQQCLSYLKGLEPKGIFAADLTECLEIQVKGMEQEELLVRLIRGHLTDIAEGKIGAITRDLKISSAEARKLIATVRDLNPRPLNGYMESRAEYIVPDVEARYEDHQWVVELNDTWTGRLGINQFYVKLLKEAQDKELKDYFEEKLARARLVVNSVEERRGILMKISMYALRQHDEYFRKKASLTPVPMETAAQELSLSPSVIGQAVREKYLLSPRGTVAFQDLFVLRH